jgi:DNA-binding NarL/FixJ family response regulator
VPAVLGPGEPEVLPVMVEEASTTGIARQVWVTEGAVEKYVHGILTKTTLSQIRAWIAPAGRGDFRLRGTLVAQFTGQMIGVAW